MAANVPTYFLRAAATRDSEYTGTPFQDTVSASYNGNLGCNKAASNAPGIGIATGFVNPKASDWPQSADTAAHESQHIGDTVDDINAIEGTDVNNDLVFVQSDSNAADDAVCDVATGGVNRTGATIATNDWLWAVVPNA